MGKSKIDLNQLMWGAIAGVITVGLMAFSYRIGYDVATTDAESEFEGTIQEISEREVSVTVKADCSEFEGGTEVVDGKETRKHCITFGESKSAFELLKALAEEKEDFSFDYDESSFGIFVNSINNFHPDTESQFWAFLVNGEMSMVGVGDYQVQDGDVLVFRVEEVEF